MNLWSSACVLLVHCHFIISILCMYCISACHGFKSVFFLCMFVQSAYSINFMKTLAGWTCTCTRVTTGSICEAWSAKQKLTNFEWQLLFSYIPHTTATSLATAAIDAGTTFYLLSWRHHFLIVGKPIAKNITKLVIQFSLTSFCCSLVSWYLVVYKRANKC